MRVFFFSYRNYSGESGGSAGVNYKLLIANRRYKMLDINYHIFKDRIFTNAENQKEEELDLKHFQPGRQDIKQSLKRIGLVMMAVSERKKRSCQKWLLSLNERFVFKEEDYFVLHDIESAEAFLKCFGFSHRGIVYHQQGVLYSEWSSAFKAKSPMYKRYSEGVLEKVFRGFNNIAFPSSGARENITCDLRIKGLLEARKTAILYNGYDRPTEATSQHDFAELKNQITNSIVFISVSTLSYAKGVDRIPWFLKKLKDRGIDVFWILVGDGQYRGSVKKSINDLRIADQVYWIKEFIDHDMVVGLYELADFYLMLHRNAIFDFATVEAMSCGTVPILTSQGGNKEVIIDGRTGFLITNSDECHSSDISKIGEAIERGTYLNMKEQCVLAQKERFSYHTFLDSYCKWIASL